MKLLREYIRSLLMEVPLDDFEYVKQDDDDVMVREEVADYFKAIPQSVNIYVAHTDDLSWAHRLPNEIQGKVSGFKSRGQTGLTDIANIGKIYPQIQKAMNPEGINLLYIYPKSYEVPAGGDTFIADVNPHYLAHDLHHMLENVPGRERGEKDKFTSLIKEYLMELVWLSHGGGSLEAEQVRNTMRRTGRRLGVANTNLLMSELFPGIKLPSGDFDLFGDVFADYLKNDGNLVLGVPEQLDYDGTVIELNPDSKHDQRAQQYEKKFKDLFDTVLDPLKGKVALFNIFEVEHREVERARKQAEEKIQADHGPILDHIKSMGGEFLSFSESYKEEGDFVLVFRLDLKPDPPLMKAEEFIQQFPKEAESIKALGYEIANAAGGMWAPTVEIRLKKTTTNESVIRSFVRETLRESRFKQMSKSKFTGLQGYLANSNFLDADPEGDLDDDDDWASEAANVLRDDLNSYFDDNFGAGYLTAIVKVDMLGTAGATKDDVLKGASYYFEDGLHFVEVMIANIDDGTIIKDVKGASDKVYEVLLHELLHMQQFLKFSRGEPTDEKWDQFMEEYKKRGGSSGMGSDYFFYDQSDGASELETFSLQMATELVNAMGKEKAVSLLQQQNPDYETIRKNSRSFRDIESRGNAPESREEFRELVKRAKQYAKNTQDGRTG